MVLHQIVFTGQYYIDADSEEEALADFERLCDSIDIDLDEWFVTK